MRVSNVLLGLLTIILLATFGCQHEIQFPRNNNKPVDSTAVIPPAAPPPALPPPAVGSSCSPDTVYFSNTILPMLTSNCAMTGCHNGTSGGDAGDYTLNTYSGIMRIVSAGNASASRLVNVISSGTMPPRGHTAISASQLAEITTWINQGALDNTCTASGCDTSNVTYSTTISTILQTNCTGCHSGSAPSGAGIDLSTYANVLVEVNNGKLWGDVSHSSGYNAMPLGGASLSACDLNMISSWIKKGAPNN